VYREFEFGREGMIGNEKCVVSREKKKGET